jgi:hypothetical protein
MFKGEIRLMDNDWTPIQGSLFEEGYLQHSLGAIASDPLVSLTELVANAWDAGASKVNIQIPSDYGEELSVIDDGTGMTRNEFHKRWMTLGYNRVKNQGLYAEFPPGRQGRRLAFGRSGVGRHGLLCFSDEYYVMTQRMNEAWEFTVRTLSGQQPFGLIEEREVTHFGTGTKLRVTVKRNLPNPDEVREVLSVRFLHDPTFSISVNGVSVHLTQLAGFIEQKELTVDGYRITATCVDSSRWARRKAYHGVAFWVAGRLVGEPSWQIGEELVLDGRTKPARRFSIIVQCDRLIDFILPDWSGFHTSELVAKIQRVVTDYANEFLKRALAGRAKETKTYLLREHRDKIEKLDILGKVEVTEFLNNVTSAAPTISADSLEVATAAVINLIQSRSGVSLLAKLSQLDPEDIKALDTLLEEWSLNDVLVVLREIDKRLSLITALDKLVNSPLAQKVDELRTIHPLVTEARWLFGPQFESEEYASNSTIKKALEKLLGARIDAAHLYNRRHRPDLICLSDSTISAVAIEHFREHGDLVELANILIIEVKRANVRLTREELNQAEGYVEDLAASGVVYGNPRINAYVVGKDLDRSLSRSNVRTIGDPEYGRVEACTFGQLIHTAERRLFRLRDNLKSRYENIPALDLVNQILSEPIQIPMDAPIK